MQSPHWTVLTALVFLCRIGGAQSPHDEETGRGRANATRQELQRLADEAAALAVGADDARREAKRREAAVIRERLREGDFRAGDHIALVIEGDSTFDDTVVVRPGRTLSVLSLPEDTLRGVLRSELQSHLAGWITRYYKRATVRATPLIRVGVLGEVNRPGYYRVPADIGISDAIMSAGGPTQRADMPKTVVRRGSRELLSKSAVRRAMAGSVTLDQLGLEEGDELVISMKRERNWMNIATVVSGLVLSLYAARGF